MTGTGNWTYLLPGAAPTLIDAGVGAAAHLDDVARLTGELSQVLVTHAHLDHASGAPALAARWHAARFAKMPWPARDGGHRVAWDPLADGARVEAGDTHLEVVHTPGHSPDHLAFWHAETRTLFAGDLLILGTTVFIPASSGGSLVDYLHSLRRVLALGARRVFPAHGPVIEEPEALLRAYLDHRHQREHQVLAALEVEPRTIEQIVARIYPALSADVLPMANETVLAHLQKLVHDGLAGCEGDRWAVLS
jgi:glyoxylase-like metal-dependent hydrolase (beta-lactamase superfamily II)